MLMRTTVELDADLHAEAKARAQRERTTLSAVVNDALAKALRPASLMRRDPMNGLGVVRLGRPVSSAEVADVLDE
jgi:Arc/MetJ family transcription regulator